MRSVSARAREALRRFNKTPVRYAPSRSFSLPLAPVSEMATALRSYTANGTIYAIVSRTANAVSSVGWEMWRPSASGRDDDRAQIARHPALDLWNNPNPYWSGQLFREILCQHLELTGEAYIVAARNPRSPLPLELWSARPDRMTPVPSPDDYLVGWVYTGPDGEQVPLMRDQVIQIRVPDPNDPYRGLGPIPSIVTELEGASAATEWNRNFFRNSAQPGGIIEFDRRLDDDEFQEMAERWRQTHQGANNAHRVAMIELGKWVDVKYTMQEMQFTELKDSTAESIRIAFAFPKPMLGTVEGSNRAVVDAMDTIFAKWTVVPRLDRFQSVLNGPYLAWWGAQGTAEFDYCNPVPGDVEAENSARDSKVSAAVSLIGAGFTPESVVEAMELPSSLKWEKPEVESEPEPEAVTGTPVEDDEIEGDSAPVDISAIVRRALRPVALATTVPVAARPGRMHPVRAAIADAEDELDATQEAWLAAVAALLASWGETVTESQLSQLAAQIRAAVNANSPATLAALTVTSAAGAELLAEAMDEMGGTAARRMVDEAAEQGVDIDPVTGDVGTVTSVAGATAAMLASGLAVAAGREALRRYTPGADGEAIARAVTRELREMSTAGLQAQLGGALSRAQNLARLATLRAASARTDLPKVTYYASEALDRNTCKPCADIDGTKITLDVADEIYSGSGGYVKCLGGVRCRGTIIAIWER